MTTKYKKSRPILLSLWKTKKIKRKLQKGIDFFRKKSIILYVAAIQRGDINARVAELADAHV